MQTREVLHEFEEVLAAGWKRSSQLVPISSDVDALRPNLKLIRSTNADCASQGAGRMSNANTMNWVN